MERTKHFISLQYTVLAALVAGIGFRISKINDSGLWLDEIWSMVKSAPENSARAVIEGAAQDSHPPLFDLLLHYYLKVAGTSDVAAKIFPLVFGLASLYATWYVCLKITGSKEKALFALGLASLNFFTVYYSYEVRFYSLMYLLSIVLLYQFWNIFKVGKLKNYVWYVIVGILLAYTHYYGTILLFVYGITALLLLAFKQITVKAFLRFAIASVIILLAFSPWLSFMFANSGATSWMEVPGIGTFFKFLYDYTGKNPLEVALYFFVLIAGIVKFKANIKLNIIVYSIIFLCFITAFIVSVTSTSIMHSRYFIVVLPALFLLAANVFTNVLQAKPKLYLILTSVLWVAMLGNLVFINKNIREGKEPWKEIAHKYAELNLQSSRPILAEEPMYIDYYLKKEGLQSMPATEIDSVNSFYFLVNKYNTITPEYLGANYNVEESITFSHKFMLLKISKK